MRTLRNHKACKCLEGRSAIIRHLISNHIRELQPHEITTNPAATAGMNIIKPTPPEIKPFKPSGMARKSLDSMICLQNLLKPSLMTLPQFLSQVKG